MAAIGKEAGIATNVVHWYFRSSERRYDPDLTERMRDTMARVAGEDNLFLMDSSTGSEDFSFYQQEIPRVIIMLGITDPKTEPSAIYANHSPRFVIDESALIVGVRALSHMAYDYMIQNPVH